MCLRNPQCYLYIYPTCPDPVHRTFQRTNYYRPPHETTYPVTVRTHVQSRPRYHFWQPEKLRIPILRILLRTCPIQYKHFVTASAHLAFQKRNKWEKRNVMSLKDTQVAHLEWKRYCILHLTLCLCYVLFFLSFFFSCRQ